MVRRLMLSRPTAPSRSIGLIIPKQSALEVSSRSIGRWGRYSSKYHRAQSASCFPNRQPNRQPPTIGCLKPERRSSFSSRRDSSTASTHPAATGLLGRSSFVLMNQPVPFSGLQPSRSPFSSTPDSPPPPKRGLFGRLAGVGATVWLLAGKTKYLLVGLKMTKMAPLLSMCGTSLAYSYFFGMV